MGVYNGKICIRQYLQVQCARYPHRNCQLCRCSMGAGIAKAMQQSYFRQHLSAISIVNANSWRILSSGSTHLSFSGSTAYFSFQPKTIGETHQRSNGSKKDSNASHVIVITLNPLQYHPLAVGTADSSGNKLRFSLSSILIPSLTL